MSEMWMVANDFFRRYMGTGLIVIFFLVALVYLFFSEKRKPVRIMFVYVPVIILLLFFNPVVTRIVYEYVDNEIYYRILWLLPVTAVVGFAVVQLWGRLGERLRFPFALVTACVIMFSGSFIYSNGFFRKAENIYHVPQSVVDICDAIKVEGREVMAVFPEEMLQYVRQYSPVICMPYGREITVDRWSYYWLELHQVMESEVVNVDRLGALSKTHECHYIILAEDKKLDGDLSEYDFVEFDRIAGYVIYKDSTKNLEIE